eukprot:TRINITY_DN5756_c0_g1_i1.p1 TRINITY_DN5756_c0_g1~~TRINITY_DN5756_c0_g1_i1.p1  ORF type:complete len:235 (+),score=93.21 TRINITY_DN5756_c0_g1_i1:225-929(+)
MEGTKSSSSAMDALSPLPKYDWDGMSDIVVHEVRQVQYLKKWQEKYEIKRRIVEKANWIAKRGTSYIPNEIESKWSIEREKKIGWNWNNFIGISAASYVTLWCFRWSLWKYVGPSPTRAAISILVGNFAAERIEKRSYVNDFDELMKLKDSPLSDQCFQWIKEARPNHEFVKKYEDEKAIKGENADFELLYNPIFYPNTIQDRSLLVFPTLPERKRLNEKMKSVEEKQKEIAKN